MKDKIFDVVEKQAPHDKVEVLDLVRLSAHPEISMAELDMIFDEGTEEKSKQKRQKGTREGKGSASMQNGKNA